VVNVIETDVVAGEDTAEIESPAQAGALLDTCVAELREAGVPVIGEFLHSYGTHVDVARQILRRAADLRAGAIVLGPDTHQTLTGDVTAYVAGHAPSHVIVINPRAGSLGRPLPAAQDRLRPRTSEISRSRPSPADQQVGDALDRAARDGEADARRLRVTELGVEPGKGGDSDDAA